MITSYPAPATASDALAWLLDPDLDIRWATVPAEQCDWCAEVGAITTVRVYGRPHPECIVTFPVEAVECCGFCAGTVTARAIAERATDAPIVVEVSRG